MLPQGTGEAHAAVALLRFDVNALYGSAIVPPVDEFQEVACFSHGSSKWGVLAATAATDTGGELLLADVDATIFPRLWMCSASELAAGLKASGTTDILVLSPQATHTERLTALFEAADKDVSGALSAAELQSLLNEAGVELTAEESETLHSRADRDGRAGLNYSEFVALVAEVVGFHENHSAGATGEMPMLPNQLAPALLFPV